MPGCCHYAEVQLNPSWGNQSEEQVQRPSFQHQLPKMPANGHLAPSARVLLLRSAPMRVLFFSLVLILLYLAFLLHVAPTEQHLGPRVTTDSGQAAREQFNPRPVDVQHPVAPPKAALLSGLNHHQDCTIDTERLASIQRRYGLENRFRYLKRYVRFHRTPGLERRGMTRLSQPLLASEFETIDIRKKSQMQKCDPPIDVEVTMSEPPSAVDASMFMFGVSTTYARLISEGTSPMQE